METVRKYVSILLLLVLCVTFSFSAFAAPLATPSQIEIIPEVMETVRATPSQMFRVPSLLASSGFSSDNSVDRSAIVVAFLYKYSSESGEWNHSVSVNVDENGDFTIPVLHDDPVLGSVVPYAIQYTLLGGALPNSGNYTMSFNFSSDVGIDYTSSSHSGAINITYTADNATTEVSNSSFVFDDSAGSVWFTYPVSLGFQNVMYLSFGTSTLPPLGGRLFVSFTRSDADPGVSAPNSGTVSGDIEQNINNQVGSISSGVSDINGSIRELIQTIINQLDALWNQFAGEFTNMFTAWQTHTDAIVSAIQNITTTASDGIENIIQAGHNDADQISGDIQSAEENITNGYDNSGMTSDNDRLDSSLNEYDSAEDALISDAEDAINGVDFDIDLTSFSGIISTISGFLQDCYENSGQFQIVINLSLLCSLASCVIGLYRFKGGG